jgi:hypothetical protein
LHLLQAESGREACGQALVQANTNIAAILVTLRRMVTLHGRNHPLGAKESRGVHQPDVISTCVIE